MEALQNITLGDIWCLLFVGQCVQIAALGLIHGHQR